MFWAVCGAAVCLAGWAGTPERWSRISSEDVQADSGLSALGHSVVKGDHWVHLDAGDFVGHSDLESSVREALTQAQFFRRRLNNTLPSEETRLQLFVISDSRNWDKSLHSVDGRQDALAAQYRDEIFVFWDTNNLAADAVRLAHELVHGRLQSCRPNLPVWLEEGLAGYLGWEMASAYRHSRGQELFRKLPPVSGRDIVSMQELTAMTAYPDDPALARRLYRQSEEWIRQLAVRIGNDRLREFVHAVCREGMLWNDVLRDRFGYSDQDFSALEDEVREQLQGGRER